MFRFFNSSLAQMSAKKIGITRITPELYFKTWEADRLCSDLIQSDKEKLDRNCSFTGSKDIYMDIVCHCN